MELTREEAISEHRKMWNWIADEIEKEKRYQYIEGLKKEYCDREGYYIRNNCFCCEYTYTKYICDYCPIEWKSEVEDFMCIQKYEEDDDEGLYALCCNERDWEEQAKLARQIANLPERQDL